MAVADHPDSKLQHDVLKALEGTHLDRASIGVTVLHGVVTLTGHVRSRGEVWLAEQALCGMTGVLAIANNLEFEVTHAHDDSGLAEAAVDALSAYRGVRGGIKVIASDGYITLTGVVPDLHLRGAAERAVRHLPGVRGVWNALKVEQAPGRCAREVTVGT